MKTLITFLVMIVALLLLLVFGTFAFIVNVLRKIYRKESLQQYFLLIIESKDQLGGTIIFDTLDFTISSNLFRWSSKGNKFAIGSMKLVDMVAKLIASGLYKAKFISLIEYRRQQTHCESAYIKEMDELRMAGVSTSLAMLQYSDLIKFFKDETFEKLFKFGDDGTVSAYGWCCDFNIIKDGEVFMTGKRGDGIKYDPSQNKLKIERF